MDTRQQDCHMELWLHFCTYYKINDTTYHEVTKMTLYMNQSLVKIARMHIGLVTKLRRELLKNRVNCGAGQADKDIDVVPVVKTCAIIGILKNTCNIKFW